MAEVEGLKAALSGHAEAETRLSGELRDRLATLPNLAAADVPDGEDEASNVELRRWLDRSAPPAGKLNATPRDHVELGEALKMMDFEAARRMSGSRFVVLRRDLARMERALGQFMLDLQTQENGYQEISPPFLVKNDASFGVGHLPKFEDDQFWALPGSALGAVAREAETNASDRSVAFRDAVEALRTERLGLIPTAEVSLTNLVRGADHA